VEEFGEEVDHGLLSKMSLYFARSVEFLRQFASIPSEVLVSDAIFDTGVWTSVRVYTYNQWLCRVTYVDNYSVI
jgi:hypothetical protein